MDIRNLHDFDLLKEKYRAMNPNLTNDGQSLRQIAEVERIQREINELQRDQRASINDKISRSTSDLSRSFRDAANLFSRAGSSKFLDVASVALNSYDRLRDQINRADQISRDIAKLIDIDRRAQQVEYAQKRIAEFEQMQKRLSQYDEFQRRIRESEKFLERARTATSPVTRSVADIVRMEKGFPQSFNYDRLRRPAADAAAFLNTVQQRAASAFTLTNAEASQLRARLFDHPPFDQRQNYLRDIVNAHDAFTESARARDSFFNELTRTVRTAVVESESEDQAVERIASLVAEKIKEPPRGISAIEMIMIVLGVAQIVISVLPALYQINLTHYQIAESQRSGQDQKEFNEKLLSILGQIAETTKNPEIAGLPYLVERPADLKARPSFKSFTIERIPKGTRVRALLVQHKWVFVEYAESLDLQPRNGWVSKKYLRGLAQY